jgi:hypothetical protein
MATSARLSRRSRCERHFEQPAVCGGSRGKDRACAGDPSRSLAAAVDDYVADGGDDDVEAVTSAGALSFIAGKTTAGPPVPGLRSAVRFTTPLAWRLTPAATCISPTTARVGREGALRDAVAGRRDRSTGRRTGHAEPARQPMRHPCRFRRQVYIAGPSTTRSTR